MAVDRNTVNGTPVWFLLLILVVAIQLMAMAKPIILNDGSHLYRFVTKQIDVEQVEDEGAAQSLDAIISGTATDEEFARLNEIEAEPEQGSQEFVRRADAVGNTPQRNK